MRTTVKFSVATGLSLALATLLAGCPGGNGASGPATYAVGGTISGLAAGQSVMLYDNDNVRGDPLMLRRNGRFTFAGRIIDGGKYGVTVASHPPADYCAVADSSGFVMGADVTDVRIVCAPPRTVTIHGTVEASEGGAMLAGVPVDARYAANGAVIASAATDATGAFSIGVNALQDFYLRAGGGHYGGTAYLTTNLQIQNLDADIARLKMYMPDSATAGALSRLIGANAATDAVFGLDVKDADDHGIAGVTVRVAPPLPRLYYNTGSGFAPAGPTRGVNDSPSVVGYLSAPAGGRVGTYTLTLSGNTGDMAIGNPLKLRLVRGEISQPIEP